MIFKTSHLVLSSGSVHSKEHHSSFLELIEQSIPNGCSKKHKFILSQLGGWKSEIKVLAGPWFLRFLGRILPCLSQASGDDHHPMAFLGLQLHYSSVSCHHIMPFSFCVSVFTWCFPLFWVQQLYWIRVHMIGFILTWFHLHSQYLPNNVTFIGTRY